MTDISDKSGARFHIRQAAVPDAPAIARVHVQSWRESYQGIVPQSHLEGLDEGERARRWHRQLEALQSPSAAFLALSGGAHGAEACGFVSCGPAREVFEGYAGEIYALYLLKAAQGTGLGRQLFETARQSLAACGINGLYLWVLSDNPAAGFYRHMGGRALGRKMLDIGGKPLEETAYGWE